MSDSVKQKALALTANQVTTLRNISNGNGSYKTPPAAVTELVFMGFVSAKSGIGASRFVVTKDGTQALWHRRNGQ